MRFDAFVGESYTLSSVVAECQRAMNQYPEVDETRYGISLNPMSMGKNYARMVGTPGLALFKDLTVIDAAAHPVRGIWSGAGRMFVAAGTKYFEIDQTGALVGFVKTIADDSTHTPVQFLANGVQLILISAGLVYVDNPVGVLQPTIDITNSGRCNTYAIAGWVTGGSINRYTDGTGGDVFTPDLEGRTIVVNGVTYTFVSFISQDWGLISGAASPGNQTNVTYSYTHSVTGLTAQTGTFLDGYYIIGRPASRAFNISALSDGLTWDQLDFDLKSGYPDELVAVFADHQELWLFGAETTEIWRNTGNADFPFQRDSSAVIHYGCVAPWSPVSVNGHVGWLSSNSAGGTIAYLANGFVPQRVSTHAVEQAWRTSGFNMKFATSFAYEDDGHFFWVISLKGTRTWVYDLTTQQWHERAYITGGVYTGEASLLSAKYHHHAFVPEWDTNGAHVVGSYDDGKLYKMSLDTYTDAGNDIYRDRTCPHVSTELRNAFIHRFEVDMETGPAIGGSTKPVVALTQSRNGGRSFIASRILTADIRSDPAPRVYWRALGKARDWVARFTVLGKSKYSAVGALIEKTDGNA